MTADAIADHVSVTRRAPRHGGARRAPRHGGARRAPRLWGAGWVLILFLGAALFPLHGRAAPLADEPGINETLEDPGEGRSSGSAAAAKGAQDLSAFRMEMIFGYASLLVDPDVGEGLGGGLSFAYGLDGRFGAELDFFFSKNDYEDRLGSIGATFLAGNISLGPLLQLTPPGSRVSVTLELDLGAYVVVPVFQESVWSLGLSGWSTVALRVTRNLGIGFKLRYHLFNLANISGPELKDLKSFQKVGVIDRLEIPFYLAFYF